MVHTRAGIELCIPLQNIVDLQKLKASLHQAQHRYHRSLETFAMYRGGVAVVVLLLRDLHVVESGE